MTEPFSLSCQNCGERLDGRAKNGRVKLFVKSRAVVIREDGTCEIMCHRCCQPTGLPIRMKLETLDMLESAGLRS